MMNTPENGGISLHYVCPLLVSGVVALPSVFLKMLIPSPNM